MSVKQHEAVIGRFDGVRVDPRLLKIQDGYNVRDLDAPAAREALTVLKESVREKGGVMTPLRIRMMGGDLYIVEGHRRHRVCMELIAEGMDIESVPAVIEERYIDDAERTLGLILSNSGEPLTEPEKAEVVRRLLNMGWSREKVQNRLGYKTPQTVANFELWLGAPAAVKEAVRSGEVAYSTAVEIARQSGGDEEKAKATLTTARATAARTGRKRVTGSTLPRGNRSPAAIEAANMRRLAEHEAHEAASKGDHSLSDLDKAIALLIGLSERGVEPKRIVQSYGTLKASRVGIASDWLYEFVTALFDHESERAEANRLPGSIQGESLSA